MRVRVRVCLCVCMRMRVCVCVSYGCTTRFSSLTSSRKTQKMAKNRERVVESIMVARRKKKNLAEIRGPAAASCFVSRC